MPFFHLVKQLDAMQCGIACMAMICRYWGEKYSLAFLGQYCHATKEGVTLKGLADLSSSIGLTQTSGKVTVEQLKECPLPSILHWDQNHFVVLYKIKNKKYYIADPAKGKLVYNEDVFLNHFTPGASTNHGKGIAMFLEPSETFGLNKEKNSNSGIDFKNLGQYLTEHRKNFVQIAIGIIFACCLQLLFPFLTQSIVDIGIHTKNIGFIWLVLFGELAIVLGRTITDVVRSWLLLHISMRINISIVRDFFIKLLKLPMAYFDTKLLGDLLQRIGDHDRIQSFLTNQVLKISFALMSFIVFSVALCYYNLIIFLIFMGFSGVYALWVTYFLDKRKQVDYEMFDAQAVNQNKTYQLISAIQEIKLQGCEERRRNEWEDAQADLFIARGKSLKIQLQEESGSVFINEIKNIVITVLTATFVISGDMTLGMMLAVQYIIGQLNSPISQVVGFIFSLQDTKISLDRINSVHSAPEEDSDDKIKRLQTSEDSISVKNLYFAYDPHGLTDTLRNISFDIPAGKITAIVGASGSGKTTLIKLLLGYYPLKSGTITIGNQNLALLNLQEWRSHCGVVLQDGFIFSESIERNIAIEDGEVNLLKLERAAEIANLSKYIHTLPLKYKTLVGAEGVGLSQGQKQRILIARAVYKEPEFIFLDEATNSLDARNEKTIVENLNQFYNGRTVVIVAHRLSTVKNADKIIVLDNGEICEEGTHKELIEKRGKYYSLVSNQLELGM